MMIMELVNAGCDLRKLSPEFLEKLCGVYEGTTSAPASAAPVVEAPKKITRADLMDKFSQALPICKANSNKSYYGYTACKLILDEIMNGRDLSMKSLKTYIHDLLKIDDPIIRDAVATLTAYCEQ
jgi:hypothetical protein